jgi:hypothetical protein
MMLDVFRANLDSYSSFFVFDVFVTFPLGAPCSLVHTSMYAAFYPWVFYPGTIFGYGEAYSRRNRIQLQEAYVV